MFILVSLDGSKAYYFLENKQYNIGRKDCDILIKNDNSISKQHAVVIVENRKIELMDVGSKYKTFLNNEELQVNETIDLKEGDIIKFGILNSSFRLEHKKINALCSNLSDSDKLCFTNLIEKLNGIVLKKWSKNCTHLVVREIMLTLKVLSALIEGIPIVSLKFWQEMLDNIGRNIPPPIEDDHVPPYSQMFLSRNVSFKYQQERKLLFKNKIFVFKTSKSKAKVQDIISLAGGRSTLYTDEMITDQKLTSDSPQYLFVADDENSQQSVSSFDEIIERLKKLNKRPIPHQEIAMALLMCSCDKDCNPNFDRVGTLMELGDANTANTPVLLAMETQLQTQTQSDILQTEGFVPETFEADIFAPVASAPVSSTQVDVVDLCESSTDKGGSKRLGEDLRNDAKRKKVEEGNQMESVDFLSPIKKHTKSKMTIEDYCKITREKSTTNTQPSTFEKSKKSLTTSIAFQRQETLLNTSKRKSDDLTSERPPKRRNERVNPFAITSHPKPTSSNNQKSPNEPKSAKTNPFARLSKLSQASKGKCNPKEIITIDDDNAVDIKGELIEIKQELTMFTITAIDSEMERSFQWLSKSQVKPENCVDVKLDISNPLAALLESFKGCVVVETKPLVVSRGRRDVGHDTVDASGHCVKNFKKFKKVKPLRVQTTVFPESSYVKVICNQTQAISSDFEDDDVDGVQNPFSKAGPSQVKKSGRKIYGI